ncbi:BMC domain-containing protein [Candidatus Dependentiae bacterium]|nr:BMC domain-containing protein [Candidatus Dependentiae bacterium]
MPIGKLQNQKLDINPIIKNKGVGEAIGIIETQGFIQLVEAVDAGLKSASVISTGWYKVGSAMVSTIFRGDVAAVKTAVSAGKTAAQKLGKVLSSYVIPRPHSSVEKII